jgi:predicted transcriptional regulator
MHMDRYTKAGTLVRKPMTIKIEPDYRKAIQAIATATGRTPSAVVRDLIISHLNGNDEEARKAS